VGYNAGGLDPPVITVSSNKTASTKGQEKLIFFFFKKKKNIREDIAKIKTLKVKLKISSKG
jgi:hypothetical protein